MERNHNSDAHTHIHTPPFYLLSQQFLSIFAVVTSTKSSTVVSHNSRGGKVQSCLSATKGIFIRNRITGNEKLHILHLHLLHGGYNYCFNYCLNTYAILQIASNYALQVNEAQGIKIELPLPFCLPVRAVQCHQTATLTVN